MTVTLTVYCWPSTNQSARRHPVWDPFAAHLMMEPDYRAWDNFKKEDYVNHILSPFNGRLVQFNTMKVQFEFESQEDLTAFVLAWS